jgi:hypothetical protein
VGALLVFWVMSYLITRKVEPWALAISEGAGEDDEAVLSASKFQALLWTLIVLFSYSSVFGARWSDFPAEVLKSLPMIPINLFLLMGFSVTTAAGAKSLAISYKSKGFVEDQSGGLITNTQGQGDLQKSQMLAWTIIGAILYLMSVFAYISNKTYTHLDVAALPDIDQTLLLLMGVSQGSYLSNKIVSKDPGKIPRISEILPLEGPIDSLVTILGKNFGGVQEESFVKMNKEQQFTVDTWSDNQIRVRVPDKIKKADKIEKVDKIDLVVYCGDNHSDKITFKVV